MAALHPADLVIEAGGYVAVTGPSGSGKSTLLHLLGLLDSLTAGRYLLDGLDTSTLNDRDRSALRGRRIGFVFQAFHLLPYRTALENVLLAELYNQTPRGDRVQAAVDAIDAVGLGHRLDALPTTLSGGECQRVAIARALVNRPSLLLCDEPTGNTGLPERGGAHGTARPAECGCFHDRGDHTRREGGVPRRPDDRDQRRSAVPASRGRSWLGQLLACRRPG
ncbi:MAG: ABC transporter ATP-binding protein [Streptosporangiaceae bacterium]